MVIMLKGENGRDVGARVKARIAEVVGTLPGGVTITPFYDQTEVIDRTVGHGPPQPARRLAARHRRAVRVPARRARGAHRGGGHSAVDAGRLHRHADLRRVGQPDVARRHRLRPDRGRRRGDDGELHPAARPRPATRRSTTTPHGSRLALFTSAATEVARPILFGVLIIVAVYLPIFTLEGLEGKMFRPMAITVCSAILGSLLLSLTVVPVVVVVPAEAVARAPRRALVRARCATATCATSRWAMDHPGRTMALALAAVSLAIGSLPFLGTEFMPKLDEGSILIETRKLPSVSLQESVEMSTRVEQIVQAFPEVQPGRHQDRPARPGHRGDGHLPGRRVRRAAPDRGRGPPAATRRR